MRLKAIKEKISNKKKISIVIVGSIAMILLFMVIYQSFSVYNLKLSETIIDAKIGSLDDVKTMAIFIDNEHQTGMNDFPTDKEFSHIRCYENEEHRPSITGVWENNSLTINGFTSNIDCNVYFVSVEEITITFYANGATLNTPTGCTNSGNNRICTCTIKFPETTCRITNTPTIARSGNQSNTILGWQLSTAANQQVAATGWVPSTITGNGTASASSSEFASPQLNANATYNAITSQVIRVTFTANGTNLGSGINTNVTRDCTRWNAGTSCTVTPPTITRAGWSNHGWRATNQNNNSGTAPSTSVSANATWFAITSRAVTMTNMITNGSFENNLTGWVVNASSPVWVHLLSDLDTGMRAHGTRSILFPVRVPSHIGISRQMSAPISNNSYYSSIRTVGTVGANVGDRLFDWLRIDGDHNNKLTFNLGFPSSSSWTRYSGIVVAGPAVNTSSPWHLRMVVVNNGGNVLRADALMLINLTAAFGAGSEPRQSWVDARVDELIYWEGDRAPITVWNREHM